MIHHTSTLLFLMACASDKPAESASTCPECPDLVGRPCSSAPTPTVDYYHCDPCGVVWRCTGTGSETAAFLYWSVTDLSCGCITADGERDTADPECTIPARPHLPQRE